MEAKDVSEGKDIFVASTVSDGELFTASELAFGSDFGSNTYNIGL